jgi:ABC-type enterochelin transport system ATPase subunit
MKMQEELQLLMEMKRDEKFLKENISKLKEQYPDKFVAIKNGKVIADGTDMNIVQDKLKKIGEDPAIISIEFVHKKGTVIIL